MIALFFKEHRPRPIFWPLAIAGLVIAVGAIKVADYDIWWHLTTGNVIALWHQIPRVDIFSYTAAGRPWVNHEWLFQLLAWLAYDAYGLASLTVFEFVSVAIIAALSFRTLRTLGLPRSAALWATAITLIAIADRIMPRPFIVGLMLTQIFIYQLLRFQSGSKPWLWDLPVLAVLWINIHGGGILAPQIVLAYAAGETIQFFISGKSGDAFPRPISRRRIRHIWMAGLLCVAACTVSPYGIDVYLFPMQHLRMDAIMANTQEWIPSLDPRLDGVVSQIFFRAILVMTLISYVVGRKTARFSHLMITVVSSLLILKGKRFTPDFIVMNIPLMFFNFHSAARRIPLTPALANVREWMHIATILMLSVVAMRIGIPATIHGGRVAEIGFGTTDAFAQSEMVVFLEQNNVRGRMLNDMALGGYLIFSRWPNERVFIDGRTPVYGNDFFREFVDAFRNWRNFEKLDDKYEFDYLVFKADQIWELRHFHKYLWENPTWKLVYAGNDGFIYVRDEPKFRDLIGKSELKRNPLIEEMKSGGEM